MSSSIRRRQSISCPKSSVELHEIYDYRCDSILDDFRQRPELPCNTICMYFPNVVQDCESLRSALGDGVEITVRDDILGITGHAQSTEREIRATVTQYRRGSRRGARSCP